MRPKEEHIGLRMGDKFETDIRLVTREMFETYIGTYWAIMGGNLIHI